MTDSERDDIFKVVNECQLCFLQWDGVSPQGLCAVCKDKFPDYKAAPELRLKRILAVMHTSKASRWPEVLEMIFDYLKGRLEQIEKKTRYGSYGID